MWIVSKVVDLVRDPPVQRRTDSDRHLRTLGAHVARVVHELRVPLSLIVGSLQSIEQLVGASAAYVRRAAGDPEVAAHAGNLHDGDLQFLAAEAPNLLAICRQGVARIDHVLGQLRGYSAPHAQRSFRSVDLADVVRESVALAFAGRSAPASVHYTISPGLEVHGDRHALSQIFVNLIANGLDAVATQPQGRVTITAHRCISECRGLKRAHAHVIVRDSGPGVSEALRAHLFEPFSSTKSNAQGLGLGLAIVKELVESHGGRVGLDAAVQEGAVFVLLLPC